jgi:uncharacterized membrane protein YcaP (DUF421 family)
MEKKDIIPWDWHRILIGMESYAFLGEVLFRTFIIYSLFLLTLRMLGKRLDGQITITEMAVMILFGAIISSPMQMHERGLLVGIIALACIWIMDRGVNFLSVKSRQVDRLVQGVCSTLVRDGVMDLSTMKATGISKQNLFAVLRQQNVSNLGNVKRMYFESCGMFSVYKNKESHPGLPVVPSNKMDLVFYEQKDTGLKVCKQCGYVAGTTSDQTLCKNCGSKDWMQAFIFHE